MLIGSILTVLAIAQLILGLWFLFGKQRNQTLLWYGLFMVGVALYVGANGLGYLGWLISQAQAEHLAWTGGAIVTTFILPFSFTFPLPRRTVRELVPWAIWPLAVFVPGILLSNAFILQDAIVNFGDGYKTEPGAYFPLLMTFFVIYWLWAIMNFLRSLRSSDGTHRQHLSIFLIGLLISFGLVAYFDIIKPLSAPTQFGYIGSLCSSIWFGFTAYILVKK
jgi:hypothetical protein